MHGKIEGKIAVVTGGASGIGRAYAERLATDGATIIIADLALATETQHHVEATGRGCFVHVCDVSSPDDVRDFADAVQGRYGQVDILVNNAGIYPMANFLGMQFTDWRRILGVNLDSVFLMCQAFLPGMTERGWGRIVNVSSGSFLKPPPGMVHYVASKAAIIGLTRALASEVGSCGVTVNCIAPGLTVTEGTSQGPGAELLAQRVSVQAIPRLEQPDDLVGTLSFLVSEDAAFVTGQTLLVNGGASFL